MRHLLDTDYVIDYLYGNQQTGALLATLQPEGLAISTITYSEIYEGIYASRDPRRAERAFRAFLTGVTVLPLTRMVARRNAQIRQLRQARRPMTHRAFDIAIAATAIVHGLALLTHNTKDYDDIDDQRYAASSVAITRAHLEREGPETAPCPPVNEKRIQSCEAAENRANSCGSG